MKIAGTTRSPTPLAALDPRTRIIAALALAFLIVLSNRWSAIGAGFVVSLASLAAARAFNRFTLRRLGELCVFAVFLLVFVPLSVPGAPFLRLGVLAWSKNGIVFALRIAV